MSSRDDSDSGIRYRSRSGLVVFGIWSLLTLAGVVYTALGAALRGEPPWFVAIWIAGILVLGLYDMSLDVILTPHGELVLRRQTWRVTGLRSVRPGAWGILFKFTNGGAKVASVGDGGWLDLCRRIKRLNPEASLNMPGMFRFPRDLDGDLIER
jgi:hypothetical protein